MGLPTTNPGLKLEEPELQIQRANHWATLPPLKRKDRSADLKGNKKSNERIDKSENGLGERGRYSANKKKKERESNCFMMIYIRLKHKKCLQI